MAERFPTVTVTERARCAWCGAPASHSVVEHVENPLRNGVPRKRANLCVRHFAECMRLEGWDAVVKT